jgi:hypothetical protein
MLDHMWNKYQKIHKGFYSFQKKIEYIYIFQ